MPLLFRTQIPLPWLLEDCLALAVTLLVLVFAVRKSRHPVPALLEAFALVFLYASLYENFAVAQGWYVYGRSLIMIGDVPLSVPLIEMDVVLTTLWLLDKMAIPAWCKPFIVGLFGMLQDFSMDPVAVRQVFTVQNATSGRWTWILGRGAANIYAIPVYNFPGWMLILGYGAAFLLIGRAWFRRSGCKPLVGCLYPFLAVVLALAALGSPLSQFLLWLGPIYQKGSAAEWAMLAFHLCLPLLLLALFWRGRMKQAVSLPDDLPAFAVVVLFHLADVLSAFSSGYTQILWLVLAASLAHAALLWSIWRAAQASAARPQPAVALSEP